MYMGNEQMNMTETNNHVLKFLITSKIKLIFIEENLWINTVI